MITIYSESINVINHLEKNIKNLWKWPPWPCSKCKSATPNDRTDRTVTELLAFQVQHGLFHGPLCTLHRLFYPSSIACHGTLSMGLLWIHYGIGVGLVWPLQASYSSHLYSSSSVYFLAISCYLYDLLYLWWSAKGWKLSDSIQIYQHMQPVSDSAFFHQKKSGLLEFVCAGAKAFLVLSRHVCDSSHAIKDPRPSKAIQGHPRPFKHI